MIKKIAVVAAAVAGLVLSNAGWAVAGSGGHGGGHGKTTVVHEKSTVVCGSGDATGVVSYHCGNTKTTKVHVVDVLFNLLSPGDEGDGGGGGNNGGGNNGGGNDGGGSGGNN